MAIEPDDTQHDSRIPPDAEYWLALSRLRGIGRASFLRLIEVYHDPRTAWESPDKVWQDAGVVRKSVETDALRGEALAWAKEQVDTLAKSDWAMVVYGSSAFPRQLTTLHHPPPYLFMRGHIPDRPAIAVVGSRLSSDYGQRVARQIASDLAYAGIVIVSGFARGIDRAAHEAALSSHGSTVAVWGTGPDIIYPAEHKNLVGAVIDSGAIITEFPFGTAPEAANFPVRNRLIAGLAEGVLVVEARSRSGALLTAQHALEQGKDVYAVPGEIGRAQSAGTNELLKAGARLVTDAADILGDLGFRARPRQVETREAVTLPLPQMTQVEQRVFDGLGGSPCHVDRLAVSLQMSASECIAALMSLQLKGIVKQEAGNVFARVR